MAAGSDFDAIVVGSGLGGSTLTYKLASYGWRVLVVERGDFLHKDAVLPGQRVGRHMYEVVRKGDPLSFVGGASKFFGAAMYRFRESDFRETVHEAGVSPAWPFSYADLEPYYAEGERLFRVHGSSAGDRTEPPRSGPYPFPPIPHDPLVARLADSLERTGTPVAPIPLALDHGSGACVLCGTCDTYLCRLDAKLDAEIAALRPAMAMGTVTVLTNAECLRVLTDSAGTQAEGVEVAVAGDVRSYRSNVVAVACGVPGSALLLTRSNCRAHPAGLGDDFGMLGRYLGGHYADVILPLVDWRSIGRRHTKTLAINHYYDAGADWPHPLGVIQLSGQAPVRQRVGRLARPFAEAFAARSLTAFYMNEAVPTAEARVVFNGDGRVRTEQPPRNAKTLTRLKSLAIGAFRHAGYPVVARRDLSLWHIVGTARMGNDATSSVTDPTGMIHGIEGLYVCDASVLPSAGAVNTGLTIVALALRIGDKIADKRADAGIATAPTRQ